jgi:hypothetical protein
MATAQVAPTLITEEGRAVAIEFNYTGDVSRLSVVTQNNPGPIFGQFYRENDKAVFRPAIPFTMGQLYFLKEGEKVLAEFQQAGDNIPPPMVVAVYPNVGHIPANQLKVYIKFNQPMRPDGVYRHIRLTDEKGRPVPGAILPLEPALWNADNTLLTVWFDPGRIKRDLQPNQAKGTPLEPGRRYSLIIDQAITDENGRELGHPFSKPLATVAADRVKPTVTGWKLSAPAAGSKGRLEVLFDETMDYGSLADKFKVVRADSNDVAFAGTFTPSADQRGLHFMPDEAWQGGDYLLIIDPGVEDLAGNNLQRLFDEDTTVENPDRDKTDWQLKFSIR